MYMDLDKDLPYADVLSDILGIRINSNLQYFYGYLGYFENIRSPLGLKKIVKFFRILSLKH